VAAISTIRQHVVRLRVALAVEVVAAPQQRHVGLRLGVLAESQ
jgi:hypothetical protein